MVRFHSLNLCVLLVSSSGNIIKKSTKEEPSVKLDDGLAKGLSVVWAKGEGIEKRNEK